MKQVRETVSLADMHAPPQNVRMHPERQIRELVRSLDKFGQCRDIVIDENNMILAGNGLKVAMESRGDPEASVIRLLGLTEKEKLKFMLADNKTFSLGVEDLDGINAVLEQLGAELDVPGYDEDTLKALVSTAEEVTDRLMEYGTIDDTEIDAIKASGERKEAAVAEIAPERGAPAESIAEARKSVVCPKCGETIWL